MKRTGQHHIFKTTVCLVLPLLLSAFTVGCSQVTESTAPMRAFAATTKPDVQVVNAANHQVPVAEEHVVGPMLPANNASTASIDGQVSKAGAQPMTEHTEKAFLATMVNVPAPNPQQIVFYNGGQSQKLVALSFDDGPDNRYTPEILDILKQNDVHATFFLIGSHAAAYPDVVKRIAADGNAIGSHTWDHAQLSRLKPAQVYTELSRADDELYTILGYHTALFRPPYGETTPTIVQEAKTMGYHLINWSVDTRDWAGTPEPQIMGLVKKEIYPGGIILQHSAGNLKNTVAALPEIIKTLKAQGYTFVTIPELLDIPAER